VIPLILDFIKSGSMQPASKPGFGHALKLSYNLISTENLSWNGENTLTYRYKFTRHVGKPTPSLLLAIMDELTTNACFGVGKPSAPGLSLQMQMEITHGTGLDSFNELDVVNTVVKKGRTISFVKSNFFDPSTQSLVAFGSHVKYMPTGSFVMDMVFNKAWAWNLYTALGGISSNRPDEYPERDLWKEAIGAHLVYKGSGSATFNITQEHVNPMGGLHVSVPNDNVCSLTRERLTWCTFAGRLSCRADGTVGRNIGPRARTGGTRVDTN